MTAVSERARPASSPYARRPYRALLGAYVPSQARRLAVLALVVLVSTALQVVNPQIIRYYIDRATTGEGVSVLVTAALFYLVFAVALQVLKVVGAYVGEKATWAMTNALRSDLMLHCLGLDMRFHTERTPGELIERVDGDVTGLGDFLSSSLLLIVSNALLIVGVLVSLLLTDLRIGAALTLYALCAILTLVRVRHIATDSWATAREADATLYGFLDERLSSLADIRSSRAEGYVLDRLSGLNSGVLRYQRTAALRANIIFVTLHGLYLFGYGGALALGVYLFTNDLTTIGTVYLVVAYTNAIYQPLNQVQQQVQDLQRTNACVRRAAELLATAPGVVGGDGAGLPDGPLPVEFDGVSFSYGEGQPEVLRDVSFRVAPGEVLGIVGRTGSGKTTITALLTRMYDPTAGTIRIAGQDVRATTFEQLRGRIGIVTQSVQLFYGSVRDNITLFDESIDDARLIEAIERLRLREWFERLSEGLDTILGSEGSGLSAGEAQLLAICRIFLRDPGIVILDEASSRLDAATERLLEETLTVLLRDRTALIIAHRPATITRADRVMILSEGRIVGLGPTADMLAQARAALPEAGEAGEAGGEVPGP